MTGLRDKPLRGFQHELGQQAATTDRSDLHTIMPAEIVDFDAATQTATVKILHVPKVLGEDMPFPELKKVPVVFPRGGGAVLTWPISAGDPGRIVIAERDISEWYESGNAKAAQTNRMHDLSDAIFEPGGMVAKPQAISGFNTSNTELRSLDGKTKVELDGSRIRGKSGDYRFVARDTKAAQIKSNEHHVTVDKDGIKMSIAPIIAGDPNPDD